MDSQLQPVRYPCPDLCACLVGRAGYYTAAYIWRGKVWSEPLQADSPHFLAHVGSAGAGYGASW